VLGEHMSDWRGLLWVVRSRLGAIPRPIKLRLGNYWMALGGKGGGGYEGGQRMGVGSREEIGDRQKQPTANGGPSKNTTSSAIAATAIVTANARQYSVEPCLHGHVSAGGNYNFC